MKPENKQLEPLTLEDLQAASGGHGQMRATKPKRKRGRGPGGSSN
jgi:hypothetical protein